MSIDATPPGWLASWQGDGVLARIETPEMALALEKLGLPTIDLRCWRQIPGVPGFDTDNTSLVRLAVIALRTHRPINRYFLVPPYMNYPGWKLHYATRAPNP